MGESLARLVLAFACLCACSSVRFEPRVVVPWPRVFVDRAPEGNTIAMHRDHLVVLREGRLVAVDLAGGRLAPISTIDVRPWRDHGMEADELRIHRDTVVVVSERWLRGKHVVDIGLFRIDASGELARVGHHRFAGSRTTIADAGAPVVVDDDRLHVYAWTVDASAGPSFEHAVVTCELRDFACSTRTLRGGPATGFYVDGDAMWVWIDGVASPATLARFGLDGVPPTVSRVEGEPVSDATWRVHDGRVSALVRSSADPFDYVAFSAELGASTSRVDVPEPTEAGLLNARLVGDAFVYGTGNGTSLRAWDELEAATLFVHGVDGETRSLALRHTIEDLAPLDNDVLVVGTRGDALAFSVVDLDPLQVRGELVEPVPVGHFVRTRGVFVSGDEIGVPIFRGLESGGLDRIGVLFLGVRSQQLALLDTVYMRGDLPERCLRRCGRGPSRPVFHDGRSFAMLRQELVEVDVREGAFVELQRVRLDRDRF